MRRPALLLGVLVLVAGCGGEPRKAEVRPPFTPAGEGMEDAAAAAAPSGRYLTARVVAPTTLRARPGGRALHRLGTRTEFGSRRVLSVTARRAGWLAVIASERPNGRRG